MFVSVLDKSQFINFLGVAPSGGHGTIQIFVKELLIQAGIGGPSGRH